MYHLAKFVFHCDLEWRFCSTSFISTFGGLSISSISILRAYLAVTFAEVRLCSSLLLRVSSELRIDLFHTSGITKRRPSYVRKSTDKPYFCWKSDLDEKFLLSFKRRYLGRRKDPAPESPSLLYLHPIIPCVSYYFFTRDDSGRVRHNANTSESGQRTFTYRATSIWNSLDKVTKEIKSRKTFKAAVKKQLRSKP